MIQLVKIVDLGDIHNESLSNVDFKKEVSEFYDNHPHNSGWSIFFNVQDQSQSEYYPLINKFLLEQGAVIGEDILIRSSW